MSFAAETLPLTVDNTGFLLDKLISMDDRFLISRAELSPCQL